MARQTKLGPQQGKQPGSCSWGRPREGLGRTTGVGGVAGETETAFYSQGPSTLPTKAVPLRHGLGNSGPGTPTKERETWTNLGGVAVSYSRKGLSLSPDTAHSTGSETESSPASPSYPRPVVWGAVFWENYIQRCYKALQWQGPVADFPWWYPEHPITLSPPHHTTLEYE